MTNDGTSKVLAPTVALLALAACATGGGRSGSDLPPLPPGVTVDLQEERYDVFGRTVNAIGRSLSRRGPAVQNRLAVGRHSWRIGWDLEWRRTEGGCAVEELLITLTSTIQLPNWLDRGSADQDLQLLWDDYLLEIRRHEEGHREIAYRAVADLYAEVSRMVASSCNELSSRISRRGEEIIGRYNALNRDFDNRERLRVRWPPYRPE